jgi:Arc/MetJ-type ribon-helix-helix transcriptional regulator
LATNPVYKIFAVTPLKESFMTETVVKLRLNQQQLELIDRTIAQGVAADRVSLVRLALREYAAARKAEAKTELKP